MRRDLTFFDKAMRGSFRVYAFILSAFLTAAIVRADPAAPIGRDNWQLLALLAMCAIAGWWDA